MQNLPHPSLENKPLPDWIVKKLAHAPRRGEGCHLWLYGMACDLLPWRAEERVYAIIREAVNDLRVMDREIRETVKNALHGANLWQPGGGSCHGGIVCSEDPLKPFDLQAWLKDHCPNEITELDLEGSCPDFYFTTPLAPWQLALRAAIPDNEIVCVQSFNNDPPPQAAKSVGEWLKHSDAPGQFICINPLKDAAGVLKEREDGSVCRSVRCLANISRRLYIVVEFDSHDMGTQLRIHAWLSLFLPLLLLVHSGRRSVHGWYYVPGMSDEEVQALFSFLKLLGVDGACKDASRLTRLPGAVRQDRDAHGTITQGEFQQLLYLDGSVSGYEKPSGFPGLRGLAKERGFK